MAKGVVFFVGLYFFSNFWASLIKKKKKKDIRLQTQTYIWVSAPTGRNYKHLRISQYGRDQGIGDSRVGVHLFPFYYIIQRASRFPCVATFFCHWTEMNHVKCDKYQKYVFKKWNCKAFYRLKFSEGQMVTLYYPSVHFMNVLLTSLLVLWISLSKTGQKHHINEVNF